MPDDGFRVQRPFLLQQRLELAPLHVPHCQVELPVDLAGVVDRDDVGVLERGREFRLGEEALAEARVPG